jgi:thiol-disulfide isomerase/thioredoxin
MIRFFDNNLSRAIITRTVILIHLLLFYGYKSKAQANDHIGPQENHHVILISDGLKKPGSNLRLKEGPVTIEMPDLYYTDDFGEKNTMAIDDHKTRDTFLISSKFKDIVLTYRTGRASTIQYLAKIGDTLILSNRSNKPELKIINRKTSKYDLNYEVNYLNSRPSMKMYNVSSLNSLNSVDLLNKSGMFDHGVYYAKLIDRLNDEKRYLDSLNGINAISKDYYAFYNNRNKYLTRSVKIDLGQSSTELINTLKEAKNDTLCFNYPFYIDFINRAAYKLYVENVPFIKSSSSAYTDSRLVFDKIAGDTLIIGKEKMRLLEDQLNHIAENFSKHDFDQYFKDFQRLYNDAITIARIKEKYLLDYNTLQHDVSNINLMNAAKESKTFQAIKKSSTGRVLYIDFWASWCAPCRQEMPASAKLRADYKGRNIDFVYLSMDTNYENWINAAKAEGLINNSFSYVLLNMGASKELLALQIKTIPRYLIFNKKGDLVSKDAPAPGSPALKKLLDKYVAE